MRVLFISAFYPPYIVGGWEQLVEDVNQRLQKRGHNTRVLTSMHGVEAPCDSGDVARMLTLESDLYHYKPRQFLHRRQRLQQNLQVTRRTIQAFQPDVVFVHVMWNLNRGIAWLAEQLCPGRVVYYVANNWPYAPDPHTDYLSSPAQSPLRNALKKFIAPLPLKMVERENKSFPLNFEHVLCVSQAVKEDLARNAGIDRANMSIVYNGVETEQFVPSERQIQGWQPGMEMSLVYIGSLVSHKGVHTAIEAMTLLTQRHHLPDLKLTLVGAGHPEYEAHLKQLVKTAQIEDRVNFLGRVAREEIPAELQKHDILIFPSTWEEPLARTMQEAMACGLVVVGTLTGGSGELLIEGETGLTFGVEDAATLANRILELREDPGLASTLAQKGRAKVLAQFDLERMIDEIENYFEALHQKEKAL
jgi:glycosyltransferase involved in cell wall biosynthesis